MNKQDLKKLEVVNRELKSLFDFVEELRNSERDVSEKDLLVFLMCYVYKIQLALFVLIWDGVMNKK